jgi:hypothetical protein
MVTTYTPQPTLSRIDTAGETLRMMRFATERDDRFVDAALAADLTAAIDALMRFRLRAQKAERGAA